MTGLGNGDTDGDAGAGVSTGTGETHCVGCVMMKGATKGATTYDNAENGGKTGATKFPKGANKGAANGPEPQKRKCTRKSAGNPDEQKKKHESNVDEDGSKGNPDEPQKKKQKSKGGKRKTDGFGKVFGRGRRGGRNYSLYGDGDGEANPPGSSSDGNDTCKGGKGTGKGSNQGELDGPGGGKGKGAKAKGSVGKGAYKDGKGGKPDHDDDSENGPDPGDDFTAGDTDESEEETHNLIVCNRCGVRNFYLAASHICAGKGGMYDTVISLTCSAKPCLKTEYYAYVDGGQAMYLRQCPHCNHMIMQCTADSQGRINGVWCANVNCQAIQRPRPRQ